MRTFIPIIFGLVLTLGFSVCEATAETSTNSPVRLTPAMFTDYEFTLISDKDYAYYLFLDNGSVNSTFGQKNGALVGLDYGWKIKDGNTLVFLGIPPGIDVENSERFSLQFRSFSKSMVVTMDGQKFKRSKFKRPKGDPVEIK
jgi:hypothetical protein